MHQCGEIHRAKTSAKIVTNNLREKYNLIVTVANELEIAK